MKTVRGLNNLLWHLFTQLRDIFVNPESLISVTAGETHRKGNTNINVPEGGELLRKRYKYTRPCMLNDVFEVLLFVVNNPAVPIAVKNMFHYISQTAHNYLYKFLPKNHNFVQVN